MKNLAVGVLCPLVLVLTACGGGGSSGGKPKSSSSAAVSSVAPASSSAAVSSVASSTAVSSSSDSSVSSSAASSSSVAAQTGVFVDSAVAGIKYLTAPSGLTGYTSPTGQYQYAEGDKVVFSIGDLVFPEVTAKGVVTPVDIAAEADSTNAARIQLNIAALLQSLDTDGNPDNGISINYNTAATVAAAVNFNQPYADFAQLPAVTTLVANSGSTTTTLVSELDAAAHLNESIADLKAKSLIGTWYVEGDSYKYVLFILDESRYASVDSDSAEGNGEAMATGNYVWDQASGKVTLSNLRRTDSDLDARPPMAEGNTFVLDGNKLTVNDDGSYDGEATTFELTRLIPSQEHPLKGGWFIGDEVVFAFTDTHYFMGQYSEPEEDNTGYPGMEMGTYSYNSSTKAITYNTLVDSNGQWGLSHPCAIISDSEHPQYENKNFFDCGPNGAAVLQTMEVTGDTLSFISQADTIANNGDEEPVPMERVVDGIPDGDIHLKLDLILTLDQYKQGELFTRDNGTMQCDLNSPREIGEFEELQESWVLGGNPAHSTWVSTVSATYDPVTKKISFDIHEAVKPVPGHDGFYEEFWETLDATYNEDATNVITGTYSEKYALTWTRGPSDVSTCTATYSVVGKLRTASEVEPEPVLLP